MKRSDPKPTRRGPTGPPWLLMLDYDGTLTPIRPRPEQARLSRETRALLNRLARLHTVVLVSGRDLVTLRRLARPGPRVGLVGTHGAECANLPGLRLLRPGLARRLRKERRAFARALFREFGDQPRLQIESKSLSAALHYRRARLTPREEAALRLRFRRLARKTVSPRLWVFQDGKKMVDLKPRGFDKASAVRALLRRYPHHRPLYAGDDLTDLRALGACGSRGFTLGVGQGVSKRKCHRWFRSPSALSRFLEKFSRRSFLDVHPSS